MADEEEERQRFSPDSSTQILKKEKHKRRKKKKHKHKSKKQKRRHSTDRNSDNEQSDSSSTSSAVSEDEKSVEKDEFVIDIKPLTEYIDDRKELNNELFKILGRKAMKKLMPKSVKKLDVDELKSRCLDQLEIISKKRLLKIMAGEEMNSSSSDSEALNECSAIEIVQELPAVLRENYPETSKDESTNILEELSVGPDQHEIDELVQGPEKNLKGQDTDLNTDALDGDEDADDTESQLMELEFRARALKSLMQARQRHGEE